MKEFKTQSYTVCIYVLSNLLLPSVLSRNHLDPCTLPGVPEVSEHVVIVVSDAGEEAGGVVHGDTCPGAELHVLHVARFWRDTALAAARP